MSETAKISETAHYMIERYGEAACQEVEKRLEELSQSGEDYSDACEIWRQVRTAILKSSTS